MTMFNKVTKTFQWGQHTVTMETGEIARQASGAVLVNIDDTVVLATVVASKTAKPGQDFFPLTVDYIEKTYAAGKIPGSFFKREAKPSRAGNADQPPDRPPDPSAVSRRLLQRSACGHPHHFAEPRSGCRHRRHDRHHRPRCRCPASPLTAPLAPPAWATSMANMCSTPAKPRARTARWIWSLPAPKPLC